jgi:hypothetical protein
MEPVHAISLHLDHEYEIDINFPRPQAARPKLRRIFVADTVKRTLVKRNDRFRQRLLNSSQPVVVHGADFVSLQTIESAFLMSLP